MRLSIQRLLGAVALTLAQASLASSGEQRCSHPTNDCNASVTVTKPTPGARCQANVGSGKIKVARGVRTRHVWKIVAAATDKGQYEWDLANGIEIIKDTDHQVLNKGITKNGHFWILNANSVPGSEIEYIAHVRLVMNHAQNQMCDSVDPRITNDN